jgi:hypothetical protein
MLNPRAFSSSVPFDGSGIMDTPHLRDLWQFRHAIGTLTHFRKPIGTWLPNI